MNTIGDIESVTAAKAVIHNERGEILVLRRSQAEDVSPTTFDLPGGRLEDGEDAAQGLIREVHEETGLNIKPKGGINKWKYREGNFNIHGTNYLCELLGGKLTLSEEHDLSIWMTPKEILDSRILPAWLIRAVTLSEGKGVRGSLFN